MKTKIFCDIAELDLIKKIVRGFSANPSLMRRAEAKDYESYSKKILSLKLIINYILIKTHLLSCEYA